MAVKTLAQFSIARRGEDYRITLEDRDGETTEFTADFDQLDLITDAIEEALDSDEEEALGVEDDEDAEEEE